MREATESATPGTEVGFVPSAVSVRTRRPHSIADWKSLFVTACAARKFHASSLLADALAGPRRPEGRLLEGIGCTDSTSLAQVAAHTFAIEQTKHANRGILPASIDGCVVRAVIETFVRSVIPASFG